MKTVISGCNCWSSIWSVIWRCWSGPSCSKLTMSLVNDLLKFTSSGMQICWNFLLKKMWVFSAKNIRILYIESPKTVNEMTLNKLVKGTTRWTTGPWYTWPAYEQSTRVKLSSLNCEIPHPFIFVSTLVCCVSGLVQGSLIYVTIIRYSLVQIF